MNDECTSIDYFDMCLYLLYLCVYIAIRAVKLLLFFNFGVVFGLVIEKLDQVGTLGSQNRSFSNIFLKDWKRKKYIKW